MDWEPRHFCLTVYKASHCNDASKQTTNAQKTSQYSIAINMKHLQKTIAAGLAGSLAILILALSPVGQTRAGHNQPQQPPKPGLTHEDIQSILDQAEAAANTTLSASGLRAVDSVP